MFAARSSLFDHRTANKHGILNSVFLLTFVKYLQVLTWNHFRTLSKQKITKFHSFRLWKWIFGPKCLQECPYPSYGKDCQEICSCDNETCNHKHGCLSMYHDNHSQCYLFYVAFNPSHTLNMYNVVIFEYRYTNVRWRQVAFNWLQNINAHYYWHKFAAVIRLPIKKENSLTEIKYRFI